jgi:hypothetical protein
MLRFVGTTDVSSPINFSCGAPNIRGLVFVQNESYSRQASMINFKRDGIAYGMGNFVSGSTGSYTITYSWANALSNESRFINGIETAGQSGNSIVNLMTGLKGSANGLGLTDTLYMFLFNTDQNIELTPFWTRYAAGATIATANTTRFAEVCAMPAVTYGNTKGGFISACADIANRWRIPFAGPTITGIRINNIGTSSCRIAKIGLYSNILDADSDTSNLLTHGILSGSTFYINGTVSGIPQNTWAGYGYATSNVGEIMNANNGSLSILFANGTVITNGGFIRIGVLSSLGTITNVRFNISLTYDYGNNWELYDMYFCSNGSSLNTETSPFINGEQLQMMLIYLIIHYHMIYHVIVLDYNHLAVNLEQFQ